MGEEVDGLTILLSPYLPRILAHHALVLYHFTENLFDPSVPSSLIASGCFLHAMKQRNTVHPSFRILCNENKREIEVAAVELCIAQLFRGKVILVESTFRINLKCLVEANADLLRANIRENIIRVAYSLIDKVYYSSYCLYPSCSAAALLLAACSLLRYPVIKFPWPRRQKIIEEIVLYVSHGVQVP